MEERKQSFGSNDKQSSSQKSIGDIFNKQVEKLYRSVNIFNWYQPINSNGRECLDYNWDPKTQHDHIIDIAHKNQLSSINQKGFRLYDNNFSIQPSFQVYEPVTVTLLELSNAISTLLESKTANTTQELRVLTYLTPSFERNSAVCQLIKDLKNSAKTPAT